MPCEMALLSTEPVTLAEIVQVGAEIDGSLALRSLFGGWLVQLVDAEEQAVLSVELSRELAGLDDVHRLTGDACRQVGDGPWWWTEASAPWGTVGETGIAVMRGLVAAKRGDLVVADGR